MKRTCEFVGPVFDPVKPDVIICVRTSYATSVQSTFPNNLKDATVTCCRMRINFLCFQKFSIEQRRSILNFVDNAFDNNYPATTNIVIMNR